MKTKDHLQILKYLEDVFNEDEEKEVQNREKMKKKEEEKKSKGNSYLMKQMTDL